LAEVDAITVVDKAFEGANSDGGVNLAPAAGGFAGRATYPTAGRGERIDLTGDEVSPLVFPRAMAVT